MWNGSGGEEGLNKRRGGERVTLKEIVITRRGKERRSRGITLAIQIIFDDKLLKR